MPIKYLGIGWDVGGWMGKSNAVAVAFWEEGYQLIQWLGRPSIFRIPESHPPVSPLSLIRYAYQNAPEDFLDQFHGVVIAIDAPLAFTLEFRKLINKGEGMLLCPERAIDNPLAFRKTERIIHKIFNKVPLSASFDKLGNNATVAMSHIQYWRDNFQFRIHPFEDESNRLRAIIEVYPSLTRQDKRITGLLPEYLDPGTDPYDAAMCVVHAISYAADGAAGFLPGLEPPPDDYPEESKKEEGWICYIPPEEE